MSRWSRLLRRTLSLCPILLLLSCAQEGGRFELSLVWPPSGPPSDPAARVFVRVEEVELDGAGEAVLPGRTLSAASPATIDAGGRVQVELPGVPYGDRRVAIVEVRASENPRSSLQLYGLSRPFSLRAGEVTQVEVSVALVAPPQAQAAQISVVGAALREDGRYLVGSSTVTLSIMTDTGARMRISNRDTFPQSPQGASREVALDEPVNPGCGGEMACEYRLDWNLEPGALELCENSDSCSRGVFAIFVDGRGFESDLVSVPIVLDERAPSLIADGSGVSPQDASGDVPVLVSIALSEAVEPSAVVVQIEGSDVVPTLSFPEDGARSAGLSYTIDPASQLGVDGSYRVLVSATDPVGNRMPATEVGTLNLDSSPPALSQLMVQPEARERDRDRHCRVFTGDGRELLGADR